MKTAISIPDHVFEAAERLCERHRIPRSRFYVMAIQRLIEDMSSGEVTRKLNKIYAQEPSEVPADLNAAQLKSLDSVVSLPGGVFKMDALFASLQDRAFRGEL